MCRGILRLYFATSFVLIEPKGFKMLKKRLLLGLIMIRLHSLHRTTSLRSIFSTSGPFFVFQMTATKISPSINKFSYL